MGKAARWFRSLLGGGGRKDQERQAASPAPSPASAPADRKRWSFARSSRDSADASAAATEGSVRGGGGSGSGSAAIARAAEAAWLRSLYDDTGRRRQSKHAIAVAAATAAAADAAVAAAQAAVEVVRLTSQGPVFGGAGAVMDPRDRAGAAVKIQTAFRGFLAKKALRALKALVRLQALVRGYLVRRQAAVTLQSMQALLRAQATVRAARGCRALPSLQPRLHHPPARPRFSLQERHADDARSEHGVAACGRRLSTSVDSAPYDRSPKTVEMDTARPRSRASPSLRAEDEWYAQSASSSPLPPPCQNHHHHLPPRIEVPTSRHFPDYDYDWCTPEKPRPATAQCTPRCAPPTPAKSVCGGPAGYHGCLAASPSCPGYMSSTQSSEAKSSRSQSAPKQRPPEQQPARNRKRVPLSEVVLQPRARLGGAGVGTHKPCNARAQAQAPDAFDFRAAVVSRFEQRASSDAAAVAERDRDVFFLKRGW